MPPYGNDMQITHEHQQIFDTTRQFVEKEINPHADEWERKGQWPAKEIFRKMGALGLLGINKPESVGGLGLDYSFQVMFAEALGFSEADLDREVQTQMFRGGQPMKLKDFLDELKRVYCSTSGFEFMHIHNPEVRNWLLERIENRTWHERFAGIRVSPSVYTTLPEIDRFVAVMTDVAARGLPA